MPFIEIDGRSPRLSCLCFNGLLEANPKTPGTTRCRHVKPVIEMERNTLVVLYVLVLIFVIVGVDLLFFRNRLWERLIVNIGIVLAFAAFYFIFIKKR